MVLVFGSLSFGQYTAMLQTVTASPNENVSVNLNVTGFNTIGSFQFYIQVDPAVLTFQNVTGFQTGIGSLTVGAAGGNVITLLWTNVTPHTWAPGTLLTLNFKYNGLTSPIAFQPANCEVASIVAGLPNILTGSFTNGAVSPVLGNAAQAHIGIISAPLGTVSVPVTYTGFPTNVGALTQKISYDPAKLTFISVTGTGSLLSGLNSNVAAGVITITKTNPLGMDINTSQLNLNFSYTTLVTTNVNFSTGCVISTVGAANIAVTYNNGRVDPGTPITSFASFAAITNAVQGQMVDVPLTFSGMPAGTNNFDVRLTYDNPRMSFIGVFDAVYPVTTSANGSSINILYTNAGAPSINMQFLVLRFMYNGVGTANVNFGAGTQFSNGSPVSVGYTNGSVTPAPATVNANIGSVNAVSPSSVAVPVTFTNIPVGTDIGAATMNIAFDASKLTYVNASNPYNATVQLTGNVLHIAWSSTTPVINYANPFITLNFNYAAVVGSEATQIIFKDGCQLANMVGTIVPANWNAGGVNLNVQYTLSGYVKYDNSPAANYALAGVTVYVKDGPEPVPPATTPVPSVIATATTDVNGFYTVNIYNGSYYLYASSSAQWISVDQGDVINLRRYIAGLPSTLDGNPLRIRAADINQDGSVDNGDVIPLRRRIAGLTPNPQYVAPDWMFQNPTVIINNANLPGANFTGTLSGDVNGTYPN